MRRLYASVRLSHDTDTTNAPRTQKKDIEAWVRDHPGNVIVGWVEDIDVSGGDPIRGREGIGALFEPELFDEWDGLIGSRTDRLFRDQLDYLLWVRDIGEKYGRFVVDAEDGIDSSTEWGRDIINDRVRTAEKERRRIARNRGRAQSEIRLDGRYGGGPIPFGLMKERYQLGIRDDGKIEYAYHLVECPQYISEARSFIARIIAGESANFVANDLNKRGIPTSQDALRILEGQPTRGGKWTASNLLRYLRSPALKGYVLNYRKKGEPRRPPTIVRGADGLPVRRVAIIDDDTWDELQEVIKDAGQGGTTGRRVNASTLLLGVAHCGECGGRLHSETKHIRSGKPGRLYYYGCQNTHYRGCTARLIPRGELDGIINDAIQLVADEPVIEVKRVRSNERDRKLAEVGQAIADLNQDQFVRGIIRPNFDELVTDLRAEHDRLRAMPQESSEEKKVPTGETIGKLWERCDINGRRAFLVGTGLRLYFIRDESGTIHHTRTEKGERPKYDIVPLPGGS